MARTPRILDHRGRPVDARDLLEERSAGRVGGIRSILTTHPAAGLAPDRLAALLRESEQPGGAERYLELAEEMEERDLHYLGVLQTRKRQVAQIGVSVDPASEDASHVADAELVKAYFEREEIEDELFDILDSVGKGFSVAEIIWEMSERQWMPMRLEHRLAKWFDFDRHTGTIVARRADASGGATSSEAGVGWIELEPWKFVVHQTRAKSGLPIRGGLARSVAWCWLFKNLTLKDWVRFAEAYGQPLRLGKYHPGATPEDRRVLLRAVTNIAADAAAIVPQEMDIEFVDDDTVRGRSEIYRDLVGYIDQQISVAVLGQSLTTQEGESGSYALGQVHNEVRRDIERSDGRQLAATLRRDLVVPMVRLNNGEPKDGLYPEVRIQREEALDLKLWVEGVDKLVRLGVGVKVDQARKMFGLETPEDKDEILEVAAPPPNADPAADPDDPGGTGHPEGETATTRRRLLMALAAAADERGDAVDAAVDRALDEWRPLMDPAVEPVLAVARDELAAGGDFESFRRRLPDVLGTMDDEAVASLLQQLAFSARVSERGDPDA